MSPLDDRPHVLVVYGEADPHDRSQWPETVTQFPTRPAAEEARAFLANYSGATVDVFPLHPPANDALTNALLTKHGAKPDADAVSLGVPSPNGAHGHIANAAQNRLFDLVNELHVETGSPGTRQVAIALARLLEDAYKF